MPCYCDYDPADIWDERRRIARKIWRCYECQEPIDIGDEYVDIAALSEGSWNHYRVCECCAEDWDRLTNLGHCKLMGGLAETIDEAYRFAGVM